jgi:cytochrome c biogenesis protein CcmG/thiol:disulfide interchange protein DsbE
MRRLFHIVPAAAFALTAVVFAWMLYQGQFMGRDPSVLPSMLIDKPAPEFVLPPLRDGGPGLTTTDLMGRVSVVNVFASWCVPCRAEHPLLMRLREEGVAALHGLNYKDARDDAIEWLDQLGDPYDRIGADRDGRVAIDWGVYGVPETFILDGEGRIRYKHVGPITPAIYEAVILPVIEGLGG